MKKVVLLILILCCAGIVSAQNIKNKYSSRSNDEGRLFFIYPSKGFKCDEIKSDLVYDITYVSTSDSVTYNFTYIANKAQPVDMVSFMSQGVKYTSSATMLFIEPSKSDKWKHRVSTKIANNDLEKLYESSQPYEIKVCSGDNSLLFQIRQKDWTKQSSIVNKILTVIKYNK